MIVVPPRSAAVLVMQAQDQVLSTFSSHNVPANANEAMQFRQLSSTNDRVLRGCHVLRNYLKRRRCVRPWMCLKRATRRDCVH